MILANEHPSMTSTGSITFPKDLLIFLPYASLTIGCRNTVLKGNWSVNKNPIMTILATQKNNISCPVSNIELG